MIEVIWGEQAEVTAGALDVLVNSLRGKIDAPFPVKLLHTVRGSGYFLRAEEVALAGKPATGYMRKQIR